VKEEDLPKLLVDLSNKSTLGWELKEEQNDFEERKKELIKEMDF
jgi:hypothetical protein